MNEEFYDKYYKKGGSYEIPCEIFRDLLNELENWIKELITVANDVMDDPNKDEETKDYVLARKFMLEEILNKLEKLKGEQNEGM